jgi:hypothetical protein
MVTAPIADYVHLMVSVAWLSLLVPAFCALVIWIALAVKRPTMFLRAFPLVILVASSVTALAYLLSFPDLSRFTSDSDVGLIPYRFVISLYASGLYLLCHMKLFPLPTKATIGREIGLGALFFFLMTIIGFNAAFEIGLSSPDLNPSLTGVYNSLAFALAVFFVVLFLILRRTKKTETTAADVNPLQRKATLLLTVTFALLFWCMPQGFGGSFATITLPSARSSWIQKMDFGTGFCLDELDRGIYSLTASKAPYLAGMSVMKDGSIVYGDGSAYPQVQVFPINSLASEYSSTNDNRYLVLWHNHSLDGLSAEGLTPPISEDSFIDRYGQGKKEDRLDLKDMEFNDENVRETAIAPILKGMPDSVTMYRTSNGYDIYNMWLFYSEGQLSDAMAWSGFESEQSLPDFITFQMALLGALLTLAFFISMRSKAEMPLGTKNGDCNAPPEVK